MTRQRSSEDLERRSAARPDWAALALLFFALMAAAPLWTGPGLVNTRAGGDSPFLFIRLHQLVENLRAGVFPARWMPDAAYGLGYPFFNFYAALPYYFAAGLNLIGFDLLASIKIVQSLGFVFCAWAMYAWSLSRFESKPAAWLAAVAYTCAPFHLVNVYVRGDSLSEFYAFVFYPLILGAVDAVVDRPAARSIARLGLAYAGLVLTHNISALVFSPFVLLYLVLRAIRRDDTHRFPFSLHPSSLILSLAGLALGAALSAWFWLPALGEAPLVQLDAQTTGYFNYNEHFRSSDLIQSSLGFDYAVEPPRTPFAMGLAQASVALAGVAAMLLTWKRGAPRLRVFTLIGLTVSTLMMTPLSRPMWDALPLLPLAQFPWRFLSVQALFASLAAGYLGAAPLSRQGPRAQPVTAQASRIAPASLAGLALAAAVLVPLRPDYLPIRADEITAERVQLYEAFTTNIGTTIRAEYLPRTMTPRPYTGPPLIDPSAPPRAIPIAGDAEAERVSRGPISQAWRVRASGDATLAFPITYFPGWQATIDGRPAEASAAADLGYVQVEAPQGEHIVAMWLGRTPIRALAEGISLVAAVGVLGRLALSKRTKDEGRRTARAVFRLRSFVAARRYEIALLVLASFGAALASMSHVVAAHDDDLTMDFEARPWLHHAAAADGIERYDAPAPLAAGRPFTLTFNWNASDAPGQMVSAQLVAPSQHAFGGPEPIASSEPGPVQTGFNQRVINIPPAISKGMYLVKITGRRAEGGETAVFLQPLFYAESPDAGGDSVWPSIADEIALRSVRLKHAQPDQLTLAFEWAALRPIAANYAVSLRLQNADGGAWASLDTQPGYGFRPTSAWLPGEVQHDAYTLALPADLPRDAAYALDVVWYRAASQQEIGRVRVPDIRLDTTYGETVVVPRPRNFGLPPMQLRVDADFVGTDFVGTDFVGTDFVGSGRVGVIRLLGYDFAQDGRRVTLTLHWRALVNVNADYKFFVHIFDPATERIAAQADAMPGGSAYPTSRWVKGEVVSESVELELAPGTYRVATGWYEPTDRDRLAAFDAQGRRLAGDRVILVEQIVVP